GIRDRNVTGVQTCALPISIGVNLLAAIAIVIALIPGVGWAWCGPILGLLFLISIWEWWLIGRQVRAIGYIERTDDLLIRRGILRSEERRVGKGWKSRGESD